MKVSRRTLVTLLVEVLVIAVIIYGINLYRTRDAASGPAPELAGVTLSGEQVSLEMFRGETVLVHFWATWCPVCDLEEGTIQSISGNTPTITVAMASGTDGEVQQHLAENSLNFTTINDTHGILSDRWGVVGVPMSFVVDPEGEIRFAELGYTTGVGLRLRLLLAELF